MVCNDNQSSSRLQCFGCCIKHFLQRFHFLVYLYAQCLKDFGELFLFAFSAEQGLYHFQKVTDGDKLLLSACLDQNRSQLAAVFQFSVQVEYICQPFFLVSVYDVGSCHSCTLVHAHVKITVEPEGETTFRVVEVMR